MYNLDKPIKDHNEDILGRGVFAKQLANAILSLSSKENFTIGLYGKWGSGKTSILNMTKEELDIKANDMDNNKKPIIIDFYPWNFSDTTELITQFFKRINNKLMKIENKTKIIKNIGRGLKKYADVIGCSGIPFGSGGVKFIKGTVEFTGQMLEDKSTDILTEKENLAKLLEKQDRKIIVIIDDIDRLSNEQIRLIFKLVNSVAGLPNIVYLLSMDKDIVVRALENVQNCNGEEYLEKMIQIPFDIPSPNEDKIYKVFLSKLEDILISKGEKIEDKRHYNNVLEKCAKPFIRSIRDVNRVINTFLFKYDLVSKEVNFADMVAINALQVLKPKVAEWICRNKYSICGANNRGKLDINYAVNFEKEKEMYLKQFKDIDQDNSENILDAISALFPLIDRKTSIYSNNVYEKELLDDKRIACIKNFDLYFSLDINSVNIATDIMKQSIQDMNLNELDQLLEQLIEEEKIYYYLEKLYDYVELIPENRLSMIINLLLNKRGKLRRKAIIKDTMVFEESKSFMCIEAMINRISSESEKYVIYEKIIEKSDIIMLERMTEILYMYNKSSSSGPERIEKRGEENMKKLGDLFVEKVDILSEEIINSNQLFLILQVVNKFNEEAYKIHMKNIIINPIKKLKYICKSLCHWENSEGKAGWRFSDEEIDNLSKEDVLKTIKEIIKKDCYNELTKLEKVKLASLLLNENKEYRDKATKEDAERLVTEWEESREKLSV